MEKKPNMKKKNELPYRFTCPVACRVIGKVKITKEEEKQAEEFIEEVLEKFNKEKEDE